LVERIISSLEDNGVAMKALAIGFVTVLNLKDVDNTNSTKIQTLMRRVLHVINSSQASASKFDSPTFIMNLLSKSNNLRRHTNKLFRINLARITAVACGYFFGGGESFEVELRQIRSAAVDWCFDAYSVDENFIIDKNDGNESQNPDNPSNNSPSDDGSGNKDECEDKDDRDKIANPLERFLLISDSLTATPLPASALNNDLYQILSIFLFLPQTPQSVVSFLGFQTSAAPTLTAVGVIGQKLSLNHQHSHTHSTKNKHHNNPIVKLLVSLSRKKIPLDDTVLSSLIKNVSPPQLFSNHTRQKFLSEDDDSDSAGKRRGGSQFKKHQNIIAQFKQKGKYYPGKIVEVLPNEEYNIHFDDGDKEEEVPAKCIKPRNQKQQLKILRDKCAICCGSTLGEDFESTTILCDGCDQEFHFECLDPPISKLPENAWFCPLCTDIENESKLRGRSQNLALDGLTALVLIEKLVKTALSTGTKIALENPSVITNMFNLTLTVPTRKSILVDGVNLLSLPNLGDLEVFWRICGLSLLLASEDETTARYCWEHVPTVKLLMMNVFTDASTSESPSHNLSTEEYQNYQRLLTDTLKSLFTPADLHERGVNLTEELNTLRENLTNSETKQINPDGLRLSHRANKNFQEKTRRDMGHVKLRLSHNTRRINKALETKFNSLVLFDSISTAPLAVPPQFQPFVTALKKTHCVFDKLLNFQDPDFLMLTLSLQKIQSGFNWIIPIIQAAPKLITRLPPSATTQLLLLTFQQQSNNSGTSNNLISIISSLTTHTIDCLKNTTSDDGPDVDSAANLLFANLESENPESRNCARQVLQEVIGGDGESATYCCGWLKKLKEFNPLLVKGARASLRNGLRFERGEVMKYYLLAIGNDDYSDDDSTKDDVTIVDVLMEAFTFRMNVMIDAMSTSKELFRFCLEKISARFNALLTSGDTSNGVETGKDYVAFTAASSKQTSSAIPLALLRSALIIIAHSNGDNSDIGDNNNDSRSIVDDLLPKEADQNFGICSATIFNAVAQTRISAISQSDWIMLIKSSHNEVAFRACRGSPLNLIPRLLLCSGLSKACVCELLRRISAVGSVKELEALTSRIKNSWGIEYENQREVETSLLDRINAYSRIHKIEESTIVKNFTFVRFLQNKNVEYMNSYKYRDKVAQSQARKSNRVSDMDCDSLNQFPEYSYFRSWNGVKGAIRKAVAEVCGGEGESGGSDVDIEIEDDFRVCDTTTTVTTTDLESAAAAVTLDSLLGCKNDEGKLKKIVSLGSRFQMGNLTRSLILVTNKNLTAEVFNLLFLRFDDEEINGFTSCLAASFFEKAGTRQLVEVFTFLCRQGSSPKEGPCIKLKKSLVIAFLDSIVIRTFPLELVLANLQEIIGMLVDMHNDDLIFKICELSKAALGGVSKALLGMVDGKENVDLTILKIYCKHPQQLELSSDKLRKVLLDSVNANFSRFLTDEFATRLDAGLANTAREIEFGASILESVAKSHPLIFLRQLSDLVKILEKDGSSDETQRNRSVNDVTVWKRRELKKDEFTHARFRKDKKRGEVVVSAKHWGYCFCEGVWYTVIKSLMCMPKDILFMNKISSNLTGEVLDMYLRLFVVMKGIDGGLIKGELKNLGDTVVVMILQRFKIANEREYNLWMMGDLDEFFGCRKDVCRDLFGIMVEEEDGEGDDMAE